MPALDPVRRGQLFDLGAHVLDRLDAGVLIVDLAGVIQYANPYCSHLYGRTSEELAGEQATDFMLDPLSPELRAEIGAAITKGRSWEGDFAVVRPDGQIVEVHAIDAPVFDDNGDVQGVITIGFDVTEERATQEQLRHMVAVAQILRDVGRTLTAELDPEQVMQTVTDAARMLAGAAVAAFLRYDEMNDLVVGAESGALIAPTVGSIVPRALTWLWDALDSSKPTSVDDLVGIDTWTPDRLDDVLPARGGRIECCVIAPVRNRAEQTIGAIVVGHRNANAFSPVTEQVLADIAAQAGIVFDIARLFRAAEHEIAARRQSEERQRFLAETSTVLSWSLDYPESYMRLAQLCVPFLADLCLVDVADANGIRRLAAVHADPAMADLASQLADRYAPDPFGSHPAASVVRGGGSEFAPEMSDDFLRSTTRSDDHYRIVRALQFTSYMCVPLTARGRTLGALTLVSAGSGRRFDESDLELAEELGRRGGLALDNLRLYEERDHVARALQSSLLPPTLPLIPGVRTTARYRAAGEGNEVGGDFYDVFQTTRSSWAFILGDVSGKGPEAAAVAGLARHTMRALAMQERSPRRLLNGLHATLMRDVERDEYCTACCGVLRRSARVENAIRLTLACAGHPPPVIRRANGSVEMATCTGPLLGLPLRNTSFRQQELMLARGDTVVMYTDGITDAHEPGQPLFGEQRLMDVIKAGPVDVDGIADRIFEEVTAYGPRDPRDDLAVIVVQVGDQNGADLGNR
jgi:PAS domain S-box-containing protein